MIVLGIDPGSRYTGYGLVDQRGERLRALAFGRIATRSADDMHERLALLLRELAALVDTWEPQVAALETPFHGLNSRSLIVLAQARGALLAALGGRGLAVREYSPSEIKSAVAGNGRADKEQVLRMVRMILSLGGEAIPEDASDALAVAVCCAHRFRLDSLATRAK